MMFLDCPAYLDHDGTVRCGLPAEVTRQFTMRSTDGSLESAMISCPAGHWFNGPVESLIRDPDAAGGSGAGDLPTGPDRARPCGVELPADLERGVCGGRHPRAARTLLHGGELRPDLQPVAIPG